MAHTEWLPGVRLRHSVPPVQYIWRIVRAGGCPSVVAQWQSTGSSSQRCPGFDSRQLPAFSLSSIFAINSFISSVRQDALSSVKLICSSVWLCWIARYSAAGNYLS